MKQGEIYLADLEPIKGSEQGGTRPVLIVSGNTMNDNFPIAIICPISTKVKNYASCVQIRKSKKNGLKTNSEVISFQIRTISKTRLVKKLGKVEKAVLKEVFSGLVDVLTI